MRWLSRVSTVCFVTRGSKIAANGEICFELKCSINLLTRRLLVSAIYLTTLTSFSLIHGHWGWTVLCPRGVAIKCYFYCSAKPFYFGFEDIPAAIFTMTPKHFYTLHLSDLTSIWLCSVKSGVLSQLEIFRKMRVSEKGLSNQIYFELAWMGRIPPQHHGNLTKLGF